MIRRTVDRTYKIARRVAVTVVGSTVLAVGVALIVLPGPAFVVIPIGLAILGLEFAWARLWLKKVRRSISIQMADSQAERAERHRDRVSR
jgi:tellurite resistance protein TerC